MSTFLMVHGAFHGGWCFDKLRPLLEREGHTVLTPTLSGLGERCHLAKLGLVNLDTHIDDVANLIEWRGLENVVLCGHSSGGMVITGVADRIPARISRLVYLDAEMPEDGDSLVSLFPALLQMLAENSRKLGGALVAPIPSAAFGVGEVHQAWVDARLTPTPLACCTQQVTLSGAHRAINERILIYNTTPISIPTPMADWYEPLRGTPGHHVYGIGGGHDFMIDNAAGLADILLRHA